MKVLLIITAVASLLVGCATSSVQHGEQWEYKVVAPPSFGLNQANQAPDVKQMGKNMEAFLNDMGKDGWILVQRAESGWYYFKRAKR